MKTDEGPNKVTTYNKKKEIKIHMTARLLRNNARH